MSTKKLTTEQFITRAREIHGDLYSYELVDYANNCTKIKIVCKDHGVFLQIPKHHINGCGCKACSYEAKAKTQASTAKSEFTTKANIIHNNKYNYELVDYKNSKTKIKIVCKEHGEFLQSPANHLQGQGCAKCALSESGWSRSHFAEKCNKNNESKGILYILECFNDNERFIKIGITSRSIKKRYTSTREMPYEYTVLHEISGDPEVIYDLETLLHRKSCNYKYIPITPFGGSSTECFEADTTYIQKLNTYINKLSHIKIRSYNAK